MKSNSRLTKLQFPFQELVKQYVIWNNMKTNFERARFKIGKEVFKMKQTNNEKGRDDQHI